MKPSHHRIIPNWLLLVFAIVLIGALGYLTWYFINQNEATTTTASITANTNSSKDSCDFTKDVTLKKGTTWSTMGLDTFDTAVCGYYATQEMPASEIMQTPAQTNAYFVITKFKDPEFQAELDKNIAEGNTVNTSSGNKYQFNLGCYANKTITADTGTVFGSGVISAILASTAAKPVALKLSFTEHLGRGCSCCNLAENVSLYK